MTGKKKKLSEKDIKKIKKQLDKGVSALELAKKYGVTRSSIYRQVKYRYQAMNTPVDIKKDIIKKIKQGYSKAEAANMYGVNIGTVRHFTKHLRGYPSQGHHIIRKHGIELLNRLLRDGCLISNYIVPTARNLQRKIPIIRSARYKNKMFFYLPGREEETIEAFFKELPDRVISYYAIEELSYLLGVKFSKKTTMTLVRKYRGKHKSYWKSRHLIQTSLKNWIDDNPFKEYAEPRFALFPKKGEW